MEIDTTLDKVSDVLKEIQKPGNTPVRVIIEETKNEANPQKFLFLDGDHFSGPENLTKNADDYLYGNKS